MRPFIYCTACVLLALVITMTIFVVIVHYFGWTPILAFVASFAVTFAILNLR